VKAVHVNSTTDSPPPRDAAVMDYHALFQNAPDAILIADDQGRYVDANLAACALFGVSMQDLLAPSRGAARSTFARKKPNRRGRNIAPIPCARRSRRSIPPVPSTRSARSPAWSPIRSRRENSRCGSSVSSPARGDTSTIHPSAWPVFRALLAPPARLGSRRLQLTVIPRTSTEDVGRANVLS
jgi:hypothetical protein